MVGDRYVFVFAVTGDTEVGCQTDDLAQIGLLPRASFPILLEAANPVASALTVSTCEAARALAGRACDIIFWRLS